MASRLCGADSVGIYFRSASFVHTESPVWDDTKQRLLFVDIATKMVFEVNQHRQCAVVEREVDSTSVNLTVTGSLIIGGDESVRILRGASAVVSLNTGGLSRLNDARIDAAGRIWLTSMDRNESRPIGALICMGPNFEYQTKVSELIVGNGVGWNQDSSVMYITDSRRGKIYCFDFDLSCARLKNKRIFADVPISTGMPDGLTVDRDGGVWSAHFNGGRVTRYFPTGEIDCVLKLPVQNPTSVCFGGPNLSTLFVTSSVQGMGAVSDFDGSILTVETEFLGCLANRFDDSVIEITDDERGS
jgi:sugar lactone lactonase YvrE